MVRQTRWAFTVLLFPIAQTLVIRAPISQFRFTSQSRAHPRCVSLLPDDAIEQLRSKLQPIKKVWSKRDPAIASTMKTIDGLLLEKVIRIMNHVPAMASLSYFVLISVTQMMGRQPSMLATFRDVITRSVGPVSNSQFSQLFSTLVT